MAKKKLVPKKIDLLGKDDFPQDGFPKLAKNDVAGSVNFNLLGKKRKK